MIQPFDLPSELESQERTLAKDVLNTLEASMCTGAGTQVVHRPRASSRAMTGADLATSDVNLLLSDGTGDRGAIHSSGYKRVLSHTHENAVPSKNGSLGSQVHALNRKPLTRALDHNGLDEGDGKFTALSMLRSIS